jgi:hypothetical protein
LGGGGGLHETDRCGAGINSSTSTRATTRLQNDDTKHVNPRRRVPSHSPPSQSSDVACLPPSAAHHSSRIRNGAAATTLAHDAEATGDELVGVAARACASVVAAMCPEAVSRCLSTRHDDARMAPCRQAGLSSPEQDGHAASDSREGKHDACAGDESAVAFRGGGDGGKTGGEGEGGGGGGGAPGGEGDDPKTGVVRRGTDLVGRVMDVVQLSKVGGLPDCCIVSLARLPHLPERNGSSTVEDVDASVGGGGGAAGGRVTSHQGVVDEAASRGANGPLSPCDPDRRGLSGMGEIPRCVCCAPSWRDAILLQLKSLEEGEIRARGAAAAGEEGMSPEGDSSQGRRGRGKRKPPEDITAVHFVTLQDNSFF